MAFFNTLNLNIPNLGFKASAKDVVTVPFRQDSFVSNPLYEKLGNPIFIENEARSNPKIQQIMKEHHLPIKVNLNELESLKKGHLKETRIVAAQIYSALPSYLKDEVKLVDLQNAALLHDYGKVLIPESILNKKGKLTAEEREIMELHSELGYELLKNKGLSNETLELVKYHHQNKNKTGYPAVDTNFECDLGLQILNVADKYSAMREKRSYKDQFSKIEALQIIAEEVNNGNVSQDIYNALLRTL